MPDVVSQPPAAEAADSTPMDVEQDGPTQTSGESTVAGSSSSSSSGSGSSDSEVKIVLPRYFLLVS